MSRLETARDFAQPGMRRSLEDVASFAQKTAKTMLRRGRRTVLLTEEWPRFGNFLYFWLHAYVNQRSGSDYRVMRNTTTEDWLRELPEVRSQLTIPRGALRAWDQREWPQPPEYYQRFGSDYSRSLLHDFVRGMLLGSPLLAGVDDGVQDAGVVVNVRRGDYTLPGHWRNFGFDLEPYLTEALRRAAERRAIPGILVVSDDPPWCRENIDHRLRQFAPTRYADHSIPREDFRAICGARTLVCANSTFSYWGGYVSNVLRDSHVIAPDFHARLVNGGVAYQLDPTWDVVPVARRALDK